MLWWSCAVTVGLAVGHAFGAFDLRQELHKRFITKGGSPLGRAAHDRPEIRLESFGDWAVSKCLRRGCIFLWLLPFREACCPDGIGKAVKPGFPRHPSLAPLAVLGRRVCLFGSAPFRGGTQRCCQWCQSAGLSPKDIR